MEIFKLFGSIFVDSSAAEESISKTDNKAGGLAKTLGNGVKTIAKWGAAIGGAAVAGGAALLGMANKSAETTDRIDKMSTKIGLSREAFQEFDFVCSQSGMSVESLQGGIKTLTAQMDKVTEGNATAAANFEKLGLSVTDSTGALKSQEDMFNEVLYTLADMEDSTERTRLATELFGKAGTELLPMLNAGSEGIEAMRNQAHELGLVMGDEAIDAGVGFADTMDQLKRSFSTVFATIGTQVIPIVSTFAEWVLAHMPEIQAVFSTVFDVIAFVVTAVSDAISVLMNWLDDLLISSQEDGSQMKEIWISVQQMFEAVFFAIWDALKSFGDFCTAFWDTFGDTILDLVGNAIQILQSLVQGGLDFIVDIFTVFAKLFQGDWEGLWEAIKQLLIHFSENLLSLFSNLWDALTNLFLNFSLALGVDWLALWENLQESCRKIWENICKWFDKAIMSPINTILGIKQRMFDAGKEIFTSLWDGMKAIWDNLWGWIGDVASKITDTLFFWRSSKDEMDDSSSSGRSVDGSHRTGLSYVPYDGYIAEVHEGEAILTKEQNARYQNGGGTTVNQYFYNVKEKETAFKVQRATKKSIRELART